MNPVVLVGDDLSVADAGLVGSVVLAPDQQDHVGCSGYDDGFFAGRVSGRSTGGVQVLDGDRDLLRGRHELTLEDILSHSNRHSSYSENPLRYLFRSDLLTRPDMCEISLERNSLVEVVA